MRYKNMFDETDDAREIDDLAANPEAESFEAQLKLMIIDALPAVCTFWQDGKLTYCNQSAADFFGLNCPQDYIESFTELSPMRQPCGTPSMEKALKYVEKALKTGYCKFEWMHQSLDGVPIPTEITLKRISWQGNFGIVGHTLDMREAKESLEMLNRLVEVAPLLMETWDSQLSLISCNEQARILLKAATRDELVNENAKFYPKYQPCGTDSKEKERAMLKQALRDGYSKFEFVLLATDGEEIPLEYSYVPIQIRRKAYIVGFGYDLRSLRSADK